MSESDFSGGPFAGGAPPMFGATGDGIARTFQASIRICLNKYAEFSGRAPRAEYWFFYLGTLLASAAASIVDVTLFGLHGIHPINSVLELALLVPSVAVTVRRLHDTDRSGWWVFIALVPIVGWILLLIWFCTRGTRGPNRFGAENGAAVG